MKWITREKVKVDRVACPWLIRKFIDPQAEFVFVPADRVMETAEYQGAVPFDVPNVELGHHGKECSFDAIVKKYGLGTDAALVLLAKIVNGADTDNKLWHQPESAGLNAVAEGFRHLGSRTTTLSTPPSGSSTMPCTPTARRWCGGGSRTGPSDEGRLAPVRHPLWPHVRLRPAVRRPGPLP